MNEMVRMVTKRIKKLCGLREPNYELPADSSIDSASIDIIQTIFNMWQWISVKDRLPPINTLILVYEKEGKVTLSGIYNLEHFKSDECTISHWMPLPQPPKEE